MLTVSRYLMVGASILFVSQLSGECLNTNQSLVVTTFQLLGVMRLVVTLALLEIKQQAIS